jgi:hypothetical protein
MRTAPTIASLMETFKLARNEAEIVAGYWKKVAARRLINYLETVAGLKFHHDYIEDLNYARMLWVRPDTVTMWII